MKHYWVSGTSAHFSYSFRFRKMYISYPSSCLEKENCSFWYLCKAVCSRLIHGYSVYFRFYK